MKPGWIIACPCCGTKIAEFSLSDEWFCDVCGEHGILEYGEEDEDEEEDIEA